MLQTLRIATRESALALWQAEYVAGRLRALYPDLNVSLVPMTTRGDQILDRPLSQIGGKGQILKEMEVTIIEQRADCAVHSLKDVPMQLDPEFALAAVLEREAPFDALLFPRNSTNLATPVSDPEAALARLPLGARVGSSSLRRQVQLRALRPDLQLLDLRGNVNTRLRKLDAGDYDAIMLAQAGMQRLGMGDRIDAVFAAPEFLPAVGQGVLAIEVRSDQTDVRALLAPLLHRDSFLCVRAERALAQTLGGNCQVPIAAFARLKNSSLHLQALVGDLRAERSIRAELTAGSHDPEGLGKALALKLLEQGAGTLLEQVK